MVEDTRRVAAHPRREVMCGIAALGVLGVGALAGCGTDGDIPSAGASDAPGGTQAAPPATDKPASSQPIAQLADIPVKGGVVVVAPNGKRVLLVQPTAGTVKGYSAACTHQGTTVGAPVDGVVTCPNHGSKFNISDGSVAKGPAGGSLKPFAVKVEGQNVLLA